MSNTDAPRGRRAYFGWTTKAGFVSVLLLAAGWHATRVFDQSPPVTLPIGQYPAPGIAPEGPFVRTLDAAAAGFDRAPGPLLGFQPAPQGLTIPAGTGDSLTCPLPSEKKRIPLQASWDYGLHLDSEDNRFQLHVGGQAQIDSVWLIGPQSMFAAPGGSPSGIGNAAATFIRPAVLPADGQIFDQFAYQIQSAFAHAS